jgi:hypothetical protein
VNRQQRRALERQLSKGQLKHPVPDAVVLHGGPMDGWVVKPDAPVLSPDWAAAFRPMAERFTPASVRQARGQYVLAADKRSAGWADAG